MSELSTATASDLRNKLQSEKQILDTRIPMQEEQLEQNRARLAEIEADIKALGPAPQTRTSDASKPSARSKD
ncbi:MAG: hypothetical protein AAF236_02190 [Verrucomicrobiota bacterium]